MNSVIPADALRSWRFTNIKLGRSTAVKILPFTIHVPKNAILIIIITGLITTPVFIVKNRVIHPNPFSLFISSKSNLESKTFKCYISIQVLFSLNCLCRHSGDERHVSEKCRKNVNSQSGSFSHHIHCTILLSATHTHRDKMHITVKNIMKNSNNS